LESSEPASAVLTALRKTGAIETLAVLGAGGFEQQSASTKEPKKLAAQEGSGPGTSVSFLHGIGELASIAMLR